MLLIYGEARGNAQQAQQLYQGRYPDRRQPTPKTFQNVERRLRTTSSLARMPPVRDAPVTSGANAEAVLNAIQHNPHASTRAVAQDTHISQSSVVRILRANKFHPYHLHLHQALHDRDFEARVNFCQWILGRVANDAEFVRRILFSDESRFHNNGTVNRHNMHYWSVENPHWVREAAFQEQWGVNVWCGILGDRLIGPVFFEEHLTGARYLELLRDELPLLLENVPLQERLAMWFQHDGAPPHRSMIVRNHLNLIHPGHWIGGHGPVSWPARSPDLTPLDFFLWGYLKQQVYAEQPENPENLRQRITVACRSITPAMLHRVRMSMERRAQVCINQQGHQFEHLLR